MDEPGASPIPDSGDDVGEVPPSNSSVTQHDDDSELSDSEIRELSDLLARVEQEPRVLQILSQRFFAGPLPPPEVLARYNELVPRSGDEIVNQWRIQGEHRRDLEKTVVISGERRADRGLWLGFAVAIIGIICGTFLAYHSYQIVGAIIAGAPLVGLVGTFIYGTQSRRAEREHKYNQMDSTTDEFPE